MMTEEDCKQRVASFADETAFEWLYNHHALPVFHFVYSIIRSKQPAEEIVNDIFVKLWQQRETLADIHHLRAYLLRSARNGASNYLRSLHQFIDLDQVSVAHIRFEPSPERLSISKEFIGIITRSIDQLPPKCKLIFKLVKEDGLKYREVAELLDISVKTVETQMTIALRRLSDVLAYIKSQQS
ncbi:RNA polymerase sigma-70 factor [Chitinophaga arvensicola]|nr:RNA polymerase sigma-70 factor [Chitinophaga arvensicola]